MVLMVMNEAHFNNNFNIFPFLIYLALVTSDRWKFDSSWPNIKTHLEGILERHLLGFFESERDHGNVSVAILGVLVDLDGAVELGQLFFQQLQVRIDEAQLQRYRLAQLLVIRRPIFPRKKTKKQTNKIQRQSMPSFRHCYSNKRHN